MRLQIIVVMCIVCTVNAALPSFHRETTVKHVSPYETVVRRHAHLRHLSVPEWRERLAEHRETVAQVFAERGRDPPSRLAPNDFYKFIPSFVTSLFPGGESASWSPAVYKPTGSGCFEHVEASFELSGDRGEITVKVDGKRDPLCEDLMLFGAAETFHIHEFEFPGTHHIHLHNVSADDARDMQQNGLRVFHFQSEVLQDVVDFVETALLWLGGMLPAVGPTVPAKTQELNVEFLKETMGITMLPRDAGMVIPPKGYVQGGDFLGIIRLDGEDPMIAFGMGAHTGHTTLVLEIDGELYVTESQVKSNYWPTDFIQKTPFDQWLKQAETASYNVVHLPLTAAARAKFNNSKAVEFFESVEGVSYGYGNFLFGWLDSPEGNFPTPLSSQLLFVIGGLLQGLLPATADLSWNQPLAHRLDVWGQGLSTYELYDLAHSRNISFGELLTMVEQDAWRYTFPTGRPGPQPSMVCDVYVIAALRAGGVFGDLQFQATEATNADVYRLNIFERAPKRPQVCVDADPDNMLCQLVGDWTLNLEYHGTVPPYPNMHNHCVGIAPDYYYGNYTC